MIFVEIEDCLGNQLFTYASAKSIALDLGVPFSYHVIRPSYVNKRNFRDAYGHEWTSDFENYLNIDISERREESLSGSWQVWREPWPREENFQESLYAINGSTILKGHFCCPRYFQHRKEEVRNWYAFEENLLAKSKEKIIEIKRQTSSAVLVAIHVRYGKDYLDMVKAIDLNYYRSALEVIASKFDGVKWSAVLFSDAIDVVLKELNSPRVIAEKGTMFEDLCLMSLCDAHIIGNSTFGWWGAWLGSKYGGFVIRPSVFPISNNEFYPLDIFPSNWEVVPAKRIEPPLTAKSFSALIKEKLSRMKNLITHYFFSKT